MEINKIRKRQRTYSKITSEKLKSYQKRNNLTDEELAHKLKSSLWDTRGYLSGKSNLTLQDIVRIEYLTGEEIFNSNQHNG